jgi:hypothetical protein
MGAVVQVCYLDTGFLLKEDGTTCYDDQSMFEILTHLKWSRDIWFFNRLLQEGFRIN